MFFRKRNPNGKKILTEKEYNQAKAIECQYTIFDLHFKRFKNRVERERYRLEYDAVKSKKELVLAQMKKEDEKPADDPTKLNKDERARLDDEVVRMDKDLKKWEDSMKFMDDELTGTKPTADNPDGTIGLETSIDAFRDLKNVYELYVKSL